MSSAIAVWLDQTLRRRAPARASLFFTLASLPLLLTLAILQHVALNQADLAQVFQRDRLAQVQSGLLALLAFLALLSAMAWRAPKGISQSTWWGWLSVTPVMGFATITAMSYGIQDTPMGVLLVEQVVLARALFSLRVLWPGLCLAAALLLLDEWGRFQGWWPHAPMLLQPTYNGVELTPWWAWWSRIVFFVVIWPFVGLLFFVFEAFARQRRELDTLARTDALTGLANRREFMTRLAAEGHRQARTGEPLAVVMIDVDHFKRINDQHGHHAGDDVLQRLGQVLSQAVRQGVDIVARMGGEEFALLMPNTDVPGATRAARKACEALKAAGFSFDGRPVTVTLSAGVACCVEGGLPEQALRLADDRLYLAKRSGRDQVLGEATGELP